MDERDELKGTKTVRIQIDNEYDRLEAVLVHRPGREVDRLTHENMRRFLFEDIPYLRRMQDEHDAFVGKMRDNGIDVLLLGELLKDLIAQPATRERIVTQACQTAGVPALVEELTALKSWDIDATVEILLAGLTTGEFREATNRRIGQSPDDDHFLLPPIPNAYFSRDPAVIIRGAAISSKMHHRERVRETLLVRAVLENHPSFQDATLTYGGTDEPTEDRPYTIEGGDVIVLSKDAVMIGAGERTRSETIELLAGKCFRLGHLQRVYEIPLPAERAYMHLDTVFTVIDRGMVVWFSQVMERIEHIHRYEPNESRLGTRRVTEERDLLGILRDEFDSDVTVVDTAGGSGHFATREQRTDGTNTLAIAPRVVVTYDRNERTRAALEAHGVTCIGIDDSELVRGLGGPRCMTMPLRRCTTD